MEYEAAISKAWRDIESLTKEKKFSVKLLSDIYEVDLENKKVLSTSCNAPAQAFTAILTLHYLKEEIVGLPPVKGEWIAFRELVGGQGYYQAFKKRVIKRIEKKYGDNPDALNDLVVRFEARKSDLADVSVVIDVFNNVPVLIEIWRADDEFGPSVDILFDKSIDLIFCTEDIVVMSELVASQI
ncbi:MAG: DUF3786 domain-containing protein [Candidatus Omnitrophota bacterium]